MYNDLKGHRKLGDLSLRQHAKLLLASAISRYDRRDATTVSQNKHVHLPQRSQRDSETD